MDRRNLKVLRVKHGLSQKEMAERIGISRSMYGEVEKGARNCSPAFMRKLQAAFSIPDAEMWALTKIYQEGEK